MPRKPKPSASTRDALLSLFEEKVPEVFLENGLDQIVPPTFGKGGKRKLIDVSMLESHPKLVELLVSMLLHLV